MIAKWYDAPDLAAEKKPRSPSLNKEAMDFVIYGPTGFFLHVPGLAQEHQRRRQGALPGVLGRPE